MVDVAVRGKRERESHPASILRRIDMHAEGLFAEGRINNLDYGLSDALISATVASASFALLA